MAKIPFTLEAWLKDKSQKVETRSGKNVRIICWDKIGVPIVALVDDTDDIVTYNRDGTTGQQMQLPSDLFLVTPEPELSEFEDRLRIICEDAVIESRLFPERTSEDFAKKHSEELLDLAREEIEEELKKNLANNDIYRVPEWLREILVMAKENGRAEALKDLPRWKKIRDNGCVDADGDTYTDCLCLLKRGWYQVMSSGTKVGGEIRYLPIRDLEKLPDEKED